LLHFNQTKLHSNASLQTKTKQHSKQHTGLKYVIYIEMTD